MDPAEIWRSLPVITRGYVSLCVVTTAACALEVITSFNIYFNSRLIWQKHEYWRLFTNFFYFGSLGLDFFFHMFFLVKYSKSLEEGSFRSRPADFLWMLLFGAGILVAAAHWVNIHFLGPSLTFMMVYVWGRRHQYVNLSFLGIFTFTAPYLPWVLLAFSGGWTPIQQRTWGTALGGTSRRGPAVAAAAAWRGRITLPLLQGAALLLGRLAC